MAKESEKKYYRIGEVSNLTGVEPHVLRYWETEFRQIRPHRVAKQRLYRQEDLLIIEKIKDLLHHQGMTITGAKKAMERSAQSPVMQRNLFQKTVDIEDILFIRNELLAILAILK
ncbi:MAG: MerR family transcriptional regulator [Deltaproteobacteria bacterium]|jgi:DNA-binding transcriptional MerR regulator|nr:MerR family transcriptional regulator [Deltaproteobacteria bacterium]